MITKERIIRGFGGFAGMVYFTFFFWPPHAYSIGSLVFGIAFGISIMVVFIMYAFWDTRCKKCKKWFVMRKNPSLTTYFDANAYEDREQVIETDFGSGSFKTQVVVIKRTHNFYYQCKKCGEYEGYYKIEIIR